MFLLKFPDYKYTCTVLSGAQQPAKSFRGFPGIVRIAKRGEAEIPFPAGAEALAWRSDNLHLV